MLFNRLTSTPQLSDLLERIQRLENEHAELLTRIECGAALHSTMAAVSTAANTAHDGRLCTRRFRVGDAPSAQTRTRARIRARSSSIAARERWSDERYMAHEDWEQTEREVAEEEYMRYAAGGFARAARAVRAADGTFLPREEPAQRVV